MEPPPQHNEKDGGATKRQDGAVDCLTNERFVVSIVGQRGVTVLDGRPLSPDTVLSTLRQNPVGLLRDAFRSRRMEIGMSGNAAFEAAILRLRILGVEINRLCDRAERGEITSVEFTVTLEPLRRQVVAISKRWGLSGDLDDALLKPC